MTQGYRPFLLRWLLTTVAVVVATKLVPGISADGWFALVAAALFLGIVNALVRPVVLLLSLPFILVTLGLFILVVNALLFWLVAGVVPGFQVDGFWNAFFGAIVVSLVNWALSAFFRGSDGRVHPISAHLAGPKTVPGRVVE